MVTLIIPILQMTKLRPKAEKRLIQELLASKWWRADFDPDLFDSRDQILSCYPLERAHSQTHLGIQEEGFHFLQQLPGPGPLVNLLQAGGGPLQQWLCASPQSGHQHQSQHLPWMERRVTSPAAPPHGLSPPPASHSHPAARTPLLCSPTPRV